jgi:hypothetical protein
MSHSQKKIVEALSSQKNIPQHKMLEKMYILFRIYISMLMLALDDVG